MSTSTSATHDASNRRASSRNRKQPEHYASSPFPSSKRKRNEPQPGIDAPENDEEEDDEEEDDGDEDDEEPDDEEVRDQARKAARKAKKPAASKKPAQKRLKTNGISLPIRGATKGLGRKRAPKKAKTQAIDHADAEAAGGIYADLFAHDKTIDEVVAEWLKAFDGHQSRALANVINFVLKAAGCNGKVTEHEIEDPDGATARLTDLQDEHQATNPTEYPLIAKGKGAAGFRASITHFVRTLIKAISAAGLMTSDPVLMENIEVWFSTMSSASNRSFRHTSTVLSLSVLTAFCEIAKELAEKAATGLRQAEMEQKKARPNKERIKQIEQKAKDARDDLELAEAHMKDWFETVFIHRYRDVDPVVRRDCIEALGDWIVTMPDAFFDGQHLRYMGWLLSDESATTRGEVIRQLRRLYSDGDKIGGLKTFTERFRTRLVEIGTSDADLTVRLAGLELLDVLRENDLLEPDDIDAIGRLVFHDDIKVRKAVAGFFSENVKDLYSSKVDELGGVDDLMDNLPEVGDGNVEAPRLAWLKFKSLAETLQTYDQEEHGVSQFERNRVDGSLILNVTGTDSRFTLAVTALYDKIDELKDWQVLAWYLLFDHSAKRSKGKGNNTLSQLKRECVLTEQEEMVLLEVLNATVKRSLSDLAEDQVTNKGKLTKKQKEQLQEELEEAVRNLTDLIPKLLKKFGETPRTAAAVLRIEGVLALPSLQTLRQDPTVNSALLDDLHKQFMSHGTDEVLGPATAAILHAKSYGELDDTALEKVSSLWEDVVGNLAELLNVTTVTVRGASEQEELVALSNNLLRIVRLATVSSCIGPLEDDSVKANDKATGKNYSGAIDFIINLVQRALHSSSADPDPEMSAFEDQVAARAAESALFYFRWKFSMLISAIKTGDTTELAYKKLESLAERRDTFAENLLKVLDGRKANDSICSTMTGCLLDLFTSAAVLRTEKAKPGVSDDYTVLIMDLHSENESVIFKVFAALERDFAKLSGKTLDQPVQDEEADMNIDADPIEDDPLSDLEDDEDAAQTQAQQQARNFKLMRPLIAERDLCVLTTKIIHAVIAGVIDGRRARKRLERNKSKLGPNFKEVLAYLDVAAMEKRATKGSKSQAKPNAKQAANGATAKTVKKTDPKSNAIVAEDEVDDEIEDDDDDDDDPEALRRRELDVDGDDGRGPDDEDVVNGYGAEGGEEEEEEEEAEESVLGD